jgi:hypothetical protein
MERTPSPQAQRNPITSPEQFFAVAQVNQLAELVAQADRHR